MKFFKPVPVTDATLLSHTIPETESGLSVYSAATTYTLGQRCFMTTGVHKIYESLQDTNLNHDPTTSPTWWVEVSPTNRWKMFDRAVGTVSEYAGDVVVKINMPATNYVDSISILDISSVATILVEILNQSDAVLWSQEFNLQYYGEDVVPDWYWYFFSPPDILNTFVFTDLPYYYDSRLQVTLTKMTTSASCSVGTLAFGTSTLVGDTQWGVKLGIIDFSKKETDEFGVTRVIERVYARTMEASAFLDNAQIPRVNRALASVRATPVIWIGSDESLFSSTTIYGFFKNFDIVLESVGGSYCNLEIEGLS